jgi:hypothetical protein
MNETLMQFQRDRKCNHIHEWPDASLEFSLRLEPPEDISQIDAEATLMHLEVIRKPSCTPPAAVNGQQTARM